MADEQGEIIILGSDGKTEHVFPSGMDPKRAADIVRRSEKPTPPAGQSSLPGFAHSDSHPLRDDAEEPTFEGNQLRESQMTPSALVGSLMMNPRMAAPVAIGLGRGLQKVGDTLKPYVPFGLMESVLSKDWHGAALAAVPQTSSTIGKVLQKVGNIIRPTGVALKDAEVVEPALQEGQVVGEVTRPAIGQGAVRMGTGPDPSFVRGQPADIPLNPERSLSAGKPPIVTPPPAVTPDPSFVRGVPAEAQTTPRPELPPARKPLVTPAPADTSGIQVSPAAKTELPVRDPKTGRMKRVYTSESKPLAVGRDAVPTFQDRVKKLSQDGMGAEDIAAALKDTPELKTATTRAERINMVREARGGPAGSLPAQAKSQIDGAIGKLKNAEEKRAFLLKAPNAAAYDYIKSQIGL